MEPSRSACSPVNFHAIGCDSYAFSGHKWLGAPHETGLYLKRDRVDEVAPTGIQRMQPSSAGCPET